ncbi:putative PurR-regulated permease PerM [Sporosarcina luteola]|nr:putative PurR-regulated permease PerM [Sporosarcina luteola]
MKKRYTFISILAVVLFVTNLLSFIVIKEQGKKLTYYNQFFFISANNLIDNYQEILDLEKRYKSESHEMEKEKMLDTFHELVPLISKHSGSVASMVSIQVPRSEYAVLESAVTKEIVMFGQAEGDKERQEHMEKLEVSLKNFKAFIDEQMINTGNCVFDWCAE